MTTWILLVYISIGVGEGATGGPLSIQNFDSQKSCLAFGAQMKADLGSKLDLYRCYAK